MKNIFVVGSEVKGESQIGYERYINRFTEMLVNTVNNISITGLKRFGKTSIAKEVISRVKSQAEVNIITVFVDLAKQKSFSDLLISIVNQLEDELLEANSADNLLEHPIYKRFVERFRSFDPASKSFRDSFDSIFKFVTKQGFKIILTIDEFDKASELFEDTADFEFFRDLCSNRDIGVSLVLVSRRQLYMIEKKNFNNSTFHGIVQTYCIEGFDDSDHKIFYQILKDKYGIEMSDREKELLHEYCGNSPYLMSMFAYNIVDQVLKGETYSIDSIYHKCEIDIENYYKSIFACLNNDKITVEGAFEEVSSIEKLVGIIIGPKVNVVEEDISILKSMGYLYTDEDKYMSISYHFTDALRRVPLKVDTWQGILDAEKKIKAMIRKQMIREYNLEKIGDEFLEKIFINIGAEKTLPTYKKFIRQSSNKYNVEVDLLDVCSFDVAVSIVEYYWHNLFSRYFNNDEWNKWELKLRLCASARNPMAHGHEEFITAEERASVNEYCESIIKILSSSDVCIIDEKNISDNKKENTSEGCNKASVNVASKNIIATATSDLQYKKGKFTIKKITYNQLQGHIEVDGNLYRGFANITDWKNKLIDLPKEAEVYDVRVLFISRGNCSVEPI